MKTSTVGSLQKLGKERLKDLLYQMILIRNFEEAVEKQFMQGKIHGTMHLCIGQEPTAVGACAVLTNEDKITSTHRGHGHCIAKGSEVKYMMAELLGKETGYCKGKGGSMHIADLEIGNIGANGIVAGGLPLGCGAALTSKKKDLGFVVVCFFGDGATNEGAFHESVNIASAWKLPVIFFCENNQYGMSSSIKEMTNIENLADRASSYGIPGVTIDGTDVIAVMEETQKALDRAKNGEGPTLIEAKTYRWRGHSKSDARKYRTRDEEHDWMTNRDGIKLFKERLLNEGIITSEEIVEVEEKVKKVLDEAIEFAENSPEPSLSSLEEDVFA
ncbi:thiamine pyrophosphate-dependent dehydrogenase E1 component subunit alpha [Peribacillus cavernae]|uniref:Thiamine pyrophosphate-dependent dehydrogenase E1 component subunit alpha n=1 Tax=Peribacillus cavernae TaxID=1674310 RepID=A0A433HJL5_9BACI|nr:thiamine pyrophosphate-dependent dehydrogenase E1 component subunit alpha [Peribacillus cavernae]MDQ0219145.1 pyruvate dehydrogenase E1 component alpha subunit [Peribacillus cavernae]RUQ28626.1 thiamine pyrophosphate-dependent dehydrogenase E1 component subunit alpha [Peribacillus cavernae]